MSIFPNPLPVIRLPNYRRLIGLYLACIEYFLPISNISGMNTPKRFNPTLPVAAFSIVIGILTMPRAGAAAPSAATLAAFDRYVHARESEENSVLATKDRFLWIDSLPTVERDKNYALLKQGKTIIRRAPDCASRDCADIPGGMIHDWEALVFVPHVTLAQALSTLQDYDHDAEYYAPEVVRAKLLSHSANTFRVYLRLKQTHVITVVLDTEYDIRYSTADEKYAASRSHSTRIQEVDDAGAARERLVDAQDDHGFLRRLNSYWHFYQADGGVYIQCRAISLTRDIPAGLGWLIGGYIESIPRDSLRFTLTATRAALQQKFHAPTE